MRRQGWMVGWALGSVVGAAVLCGGAVAQEADVTPNGTVLKTGDFCYTIVQKQNGAEKPIGLTFQSVRRERVGGAEALSIVVHQHLSDGKLDMRDHFLLRRADLQPIRLDTVKDGKPHVHLDYSPGHISGWKMVGGTKQAIDLPVDGPVWDGNLWGETFAALPLEAGKAYRLPMYQYDRGKGFFFVSVAARESFKTGSGNVDAWKVRAGIKRDEQVNYFVGSGARLELGYDAGPSAQRLGGSCGGLK